MKLLLVRHGETDHNVAGILQGHGRMPLNATGRRQAQHVAERLRKEKIDVAYVSDLPRTRETADIILVFHPETKVVYTKELRERHYGIFEGKTGIEMKTNWEQSGVPFEKYKPNGGESPLEVQRRIVRFYEKIVQKHHRGTVLWVSHGGVIRAILSALEKQPWTIETHEKYHPPNCALTVLEIDEQQQHRITVLNSVEHFGI